MASTSAPASSTNDHGHAHGHGTDAHDHDSGEVHAHIASTKFYVGIFAALIFLTYVTVQVSYFDFGAANTIVAVLVATIKATLVAAFFMHLTHDKLFNVIALLSAFLFLGVFLLLTNEDTATRNRVDDANGAHVAPRSGDFAPGGLEPARVGGGGHAPAGLEGQSLPQQGGMHKTTETPSH
jgi:cytochrome c oxidase subunit 4